jgi:hypothetical protein
MKSAAMKRKRHPIFWLIVFALSWLAASGSSLAGDFGILPQLCGPCFLRGPEIEALTYKNPPKGATPFFLEAQKKDGTVRKVFERADPGCFMFEVNPKEMPVWLMGRPWKLGLILKNGCSTTIDKGPRQGIADYILTRPYKTLGLLVGLDEAGQDQKARMSLRVYGDGKELGRAICLKMGEPKLMRLDLKGVKRLTFSVGVYISTPGLRNPARAALTSVYAW